MRLFLIRSLALLRRGTGRGLNAAGFPDPTAVSGASLLGQKGPGKPGVGPLHPRGHKLTNLGEKEQVTIQGILQAAGEGGLPDA